MINYGLANNIKGSGKTSFLSNYKSALMFLLKTTEFYLSQNLLWIRWDFQGCGSRVTETT